MVDRRECWLHIVEISCWCVHLFRNIVTKGKVKKIKFELTDVVHFWRTTWHYEVLIFADILTWMRQTVREIFEFFHFKRTPISHVTFFDEFLRCFRQNVSHKSFHTFTNEIFVLSDYQYLGWFSRITDFKKMLHFSLTPCISVTVHRALLVFNRFPNDMNSHSSTTLE